MKTEIWDHGYGGLMRFCWLVITSYTIFENFKVHVIEFKEQENINRLNREISFRISAKLGIQLLFSQNRSLRKSQGNPSPSISWKVQ